MAHTGREELAAMPLIPPERRPTAWIGLATVTLLLVGLGLAARQWRLPRFGPPERTPPVEDAGDRVIDDALSQIPSAVDSVALKSRWTDEIEGLELTQLSPERREIFLRFANAERCTCGCGYTLAACRVYDPNCPSSPKRVEALLDSVRKGLIRRASGVRERPSSSG
jgi:hypothetical protein